MISLHPMHKCKPFINVLFSRIAELTIAAPKEVLTCSASSEYNSNFQCEGALDPNIDVDWASRFATIGEWIVVSFLDGVALEVTSIRLLNRKWGGF